MSEIYVKHDKYTDGCAAGAVLAEAEESAFMAAWKGSLTIDLRDQLTEISKRRANERAKHMRHGWGVGVGIYTTKHPAYKIWKNLIPKVHTFLNPEEAIKKNPDIFSGICGEWLYFPNFAKWFDEQMESSNVGWQLDKDLFCVHYRHYGPDTCCLLHPDINRLLRLYDPRSGIKKNKRSGKWS